MIVMAHINAKNGDWGATMSDSIDPKTESGMRSWDLQSDGVID